VQCSVTVSSQQPLITGTATIKKRQLYGCRPKYVIAGSGCSLGCTPALLMTHSTVEAAHAAIYLIWTSYI